MMTTKDIGDWMNALPEATDFYGRTLATTNSAGSKARMSTGRLGLTSLASAEAPGSVLGVMEFIEKYVYAKPVGHWLIDLNHSNALSWYVGLTDSINLNMQWYIAEVVKTSLNLNAAWRQITVLFKPAYQNADGFYLVTATTGATSSDRSVTVKKTPINHL